jgi:hypothetical protein
MPNRQEKSDLFIVAMKLANKPWATGRGVGGSQGRGPRGTQAGNTCAGLRAIVS